MVLAVGYDQVRTLADRYPSFGKLFPGLKMIGKEEIGKIEPRILEGRDPEQKLLALLTEDGYTVDFRKLSLSFVNNSEALNRVSTAKWIAQAYVDMGQFSSAILEYETILQRFPEDADVQTALRLIESKANSAAVDAGLGDTVMMSKRLGDTTSTTNTTHTTRIQRQVARDVDDGRRIMQKVFVDTKVITAGDFDLCWTTPDFGGPLNGVVDPFVQVLADKGVLPVEKSLKLLSDKSRCAYLPLQLYDIDMDLAIGFLRI